MSARAIPVLVCFLLGLAGPPAVSGEAEADPVAAFARQRMAFAKVQKLETGAVDKLNAIRALAAEGKFEEAVKRAQAWIAGHPVDAEAHMMCAAILHSSGDFQGYFKHRFIGRGLLASIAASGSGRSEETAMKVINVREEHAVLRDLGGKLKKQALIHGKDGRQYDRLVCEIGGKEVTLYFDVTVWMQTIKRAMNLGPAGKDAGDEKPAPKKASSPAPPDEPKRP